MKKFFVEQVNVGVTKGGFACGPIPGNVIGEIALKSKDGQIRYYSLAEVAGTLNFFESETSLYQGQIEEKFDDQNFSELLDKSYTAGYGSYIDFYEEVNASQPLSNTALVQKYLAYLVRADWAETERFKAETLGKALGDFEIPLCDEEKDYLEETDDDY